MGLLFPSPRKLETKLLSTQDDLKKVLKAKAAKKRVLGTFQFFRRTFYFIFIIELVIIFIMRRKNTVKSTLYVIGQRELPIFLAILAIFRYLFIAIIEFQINSLTEESYDLRYKLEKYFNEYQSDPKFQKVKRALEKRGEYTDIDFDQLLNLEYYADTGDSVNQGLMQRILNLITQSGPDYRYAVICPNCYTHNGTIDESEIDTLKYKCKMCRAVVTMKKVLEYPKDEEFNQAPKVDDQKEIEKLDSSDDDQLGELR